MFILSRVKQWDTGIVQSPLLARAWSDHQQASLILILALVWAGGWAMWPPEMPSNLNYFMVLFDTHFLYWFSHGAVPVINSSLLIIFPLIQTCIEQEWLPEGQRGDRGFNYMGTIARCKWWPHMRLVGEIWISLKLFGICNRISLEFSSNLSKFQLKLSIEKCKTYCDDKCLKANIAFFSLLFSDKSHSLAALRRALGYLGFSESPTALAGPLRAGFLMQP